MSHAPHTPYLELRALAEDLAEATSAAERRQITAALTHWLACHCACCGALLWVERRARKPITTCLACELADIPPPPDASDDVPF